MAFEPLNELERLLVAAAGEPAARPAFYRALLEDELLVVTEGPAPAEESRRVLEADRAFRVLMDLEGRPHAPIFTSKERVAAVVTSEVAYMAMKGRDLFTTMRGSDFILNPGSDYAKLFWANEVEAMLDGSIFESSRQIDVGRKEILLGQPSVYPHHLTDAFARAFRGVRDVRAAYVAHAAIAGLGGPCTLIVVDTAGEWEAVADAVDVVMPEAWRPGEKVSIMPLSADPDDPVGRYVTRETKPFYRRK